MSIFEKKNIYFLLQPQEKKDEINMKNTRYDIQNAAFGNATSEE